MKGLTSSDLYSLASLKFDWTRKNETSSPSIIPPHEAMCLLRSCLYCLHLQFQKVTACLPESSSILNGFLPNKLSYTSISNHDFAYYLSLALILLCLSLFFMYTFFHGFHSIT